MRGRKQRRGKKRDSRKGNSFVLMCAKAALAACVLTVALVLLFALLLKWEVLGEDIIPVVTTAIKGLCAACAGLLAGMAASERCWLWGGISGAVYILLAFLAFSLVEKSLALSLGILADVGLGIVAGAVAGMLMQMRKN